MAEEGVDSSLGSREGKMRVSVAGKEWGCGQVALQPFPPSRQLPAGAQASVQAGEVLHSACALCFNGHVTAL